jgi:hypothetical protein
MGKRIIAVVAIVLVGVLAVVALSIWILPRDAEAAQQGYRGAGRAQSGTSENDTQVLPAVEADASGLSETEVEALLMALDDEYKAWSVYEQVISDLGSVRPFTNIQRAEENHIAALVNLMERYELEAPENQWIGNVPSYATLGDACEAGVEAEIDNAALYDQLFSMVHSEEIERVFTALQQASEDKHLPAFERCAD